ncbi:MAG TPA: FliH/SctL family protein [Polyangia bacterium]|jgi:flagellar biosynthesis/type III secretory pathway protein FliH
MGRLVQSFGRVVPAVVVDASVEARSLVAEARRQAEALMTAARAEAEVVRAEARHAGALEGRVASEVAFTSMQVEARAEAERVRRAAMPAAQVLAVRMAEKIIGRAVALDASIMADIARQALEAVRARTGVLLLRVHPDDWAAVEAARPALAARLAKAVELRLVADVEVGRHGCVVESAAGRLDARLDTQLAALERAVFGHG